MGEVTVTKGDEVAFFCPRHGASVTREIGQLGINLQTDWFNCWSCGFKGKTLEPFFRLSRDKEALDQYLSEINDRRPAEKAKKEYDTPRLPDGFKPLSVPSRNPFLNQAKDYLAHRGLTPGDILVYRLGYCQEGEFRGRIIIPSFDEYGELNFVTSRAIGDVPKAVRYKNGNYDKNIIFNDYMVDWKKPVILTEGPFDAFRAGPNAIPLQGDLFSESSRLFNKIVLSGVDVYFALDTDAFKKQLKIIELFLSYGVRSHFVGLLGKKDVGEMTKEEFTLARSMAIPIRDDLDLIRLRVSA